jgi:hypothetical protein
LDGLFDQVALLGVVLQGLLVLFLCLLLGLKLIVFLVHFLLQIIDSLFKFSLLLLQPLGLLIEINELLQGYKYLGGGPDIDGAAAFGYIGFAL